MSNEKKSALSKSREENGGLWQAIKYVFCTMSAGIIEFALFTILLHVLPIDPHKTINFVQELPLRNFVATIISLCVATLWNFTINRKFTFKSAANIPRAMFLAFLFYVPFFPLKLWLNGFLPLYFAKNAAAQAGMTPLMYVNAHKYIAIIVEVFTLLLNGVCEFCWQKFVIYRNQINTNEDAQKIKEKAE
ncbi:MAG: hypothetical protein Q4E28_05135 [Clostridia bacterium]|nr:hypothetical protein [Clostridia bacterium]